MMLAIVLVGACTYALRAVPLVAPRPGATHRSSALRRVPAAILPVLVASTLMGAGAEGIDVRLGAAAIAVAVAWRTRNVAATLGLGMVALWLLQAFA
ncbi:MAG: AzlD domain-containing protein [Deltaproteobacteria bacterium]|nr:AzlD domain-containing protein [Deltaproteobacteria bacterium]